MSIKREKRISYKVLIEIGMFFFLNHVFMKYPYGAGLFNNSYDISTVIFVILTLSITLRIYWQPNDNKWPFPVLFFGFIVGSVEFSYFIRAEISVIEHETGFFKFSQVLGGLITGGIFGAFVALIISSVFYFAILNIFGNKSG